MDSDSLSSCYKKFPSNILAAPTQESKSILTALIKSPQLPGRDAAEDLMKQLQAGEGSTEPSKRLLFTAQESRQPGTEEWQE